MTAKAHRRREEPPPPPPGGLGEGSNAEAGSLTSRDQTRHFVESFSHAARAFLGGLLKTRFGCVKTWINWGA